MGEHPNDSEWLRMTQNDSIWLRMTQNDSSSKVNFLTLFQMTHPDSLWLIMTHPDSSWLTMTHSDLVQLRNTTTKKYPEIKHNQSHLVKATLTQHDSVWLRMTHCDSPWLTMTCLELSENSGQVNWFGEKHREVTQHDSEWCLVTTSDSAWLTMTHPDSLWLTHTGRDQLVSGLSRKRLIVSHTNSCNIYYRSREKASNENWKDPKDI